MNWITFAGRRTKPLVCATLVIVGCRAAATPMGSADDVMAKDVIVGVNIENIEHISPEQQDVLIEQLQQNNINTIRTGMLR